MRCAGLAAASTAGAGRRRVASFAPPAFIEDVAAEQPALAGDDDLGLAGLEAGLGRAGAVLDARDEQARRDRQAEELGDRRCSAPARRRRARRGRPGPGARSWSTTSRTVLIGTAKPMPTFPTSADDEPVAICVLTPITWPAAFRSGPPELPRLMGASVWITRSIGDSRRRLDRALQRADDARRDRALEPERVADRDHRVADLDVLGVAELDRGERACVGVDLEQRDVGRLVGRRSIAGPSCSPCWRS